MSNEYHRPTYTFPYGAYNATEVRLYGKPGIMETPAEISIGGSNYQIDFILTRKRDDNEHSKEARDRKEPDDELIRRLRERGRTITFPEMDQWYIPKVGMSLTSMFLLDSTGLDQMVMLASGILTLDGVLPDGLKPLSWGVIYGYAYEGHTYDLPKPKVMLLPVEPQSLPDDDSGYYEKRDANYKVWVVDKLSECVEIDVNRGFIEQIVLEANLPGKRSPNMYAGRAALAHRSGRLSE